MSQDGASQFQEVIRQELELSVKKELEKILTTASSHEFETPGFAILPRLVSNS
ncbi:UGP2 isoform 26 [Pan troglodytes]|uniref:UDP-glucose pyrophosphorylase 2 n=12 Tax=Catarrhini TaxID=9526 RepID=F8WC70_HUMAN|nr:UDP-glucose pyrophosphorylase 2 [Homo sapiens]PNI66429.1 UGP2 isoform 2 [Pan troglodytes]KAI2523620.1 UDP-glucose pyrophosphorylase 2 [Homo sapiens]KAI2523621.1 UDP-glucose pyrophosphorylase 2 [Homo sapiens]KAI2523622.1 UDP-glucose pyrophosphorylase 2 [Homo sapiens]